MVSKVPEAVESSTSTPKANGASVQAKEGKKEAQKEGARSGTPHHPRKEGSVNKPSQDAELKDYVSIGRQPDRTFVIANADASSATWGLSWQRGFRFCIQGT